MLESEHMTADYAYGDNKQQDSASFGIFKQNWGLLRECCSRFKGQPQSNWNNGAVLEYVCTSPLSVQTVVLLHVMHVVY